jgi:hypothetical protein
MGSSITSAKMSPVSWDALEKVEPFIEAVMHHLAVLKAARRVCRKRCYAR